MKTRRGTYGTNNIDTPPLDSHFLKRSTTPRLSLPVDGVKDDVVEPTTLQKLNVEEACTTSDDTAQTDTTVNATTTPAKSNQQVVEEEEVEPPLNSEQVESDLKKDVDNEDVLSVDCGGSDNDVVITEKENDEDLFVAKLPDHTDDVSTYSNRHPCDSGYKPHKQ